MLIIDILITVSAALLVLVFILIVVLVKQGRLLRATQAILDGRAPKKREPEKRRVQIVTCHGNAETVLATRHMNGWAIPWCDCPKAKAYYGKPDGSFDAADNLAPRRWAFEDTGKPEFTKLKLIHVEQELHDED